MSNTNEYRAGLIRPNFEMIEAAGLPDMGPRWCAWRHEDRAGGKPAKVPYCSKHKRLTTSDPDTWLTYDLAKALYLSGGFDGVGYLPMFDDGITALDLDGVIASDGTGVDSGAQIVQCLDDIGCYVERSPSGKGVRAFVKGIREGGTKVSLSGHSIEAYQADPNWRDGSPAVQPHYVTVTGAYWRDDLRPLAPDQAQQNLEEFLSLTGLLGPGPGEVIEIAEGFDGWKRRSDEEVKRLLLGSYNQRGKINAAWGGDTTLHGGQSEARGALILQLWYITRDAEQIRRLVLQSGLDQSKFSGRRNGYADFLEYEICRAGAKQKRNIDSDQTQKAAAGDRAKAGAEALNTKAREVTGGAGLDDLKNPKGGFDSTLHVATQLLVCDARLCGVVYLDTFANDLKKSIPLSDAFNDPSATRRHGQWTDGDDFAIESYLYREWRVKATPATAKAAAYRWGAATPRNPVADRLNSLGDSWDKVSRLDRLFADYFGADVEGDSGAYLSEIGKRFMVGVVARALKPGAKQDQMLVLEGGQGGYKSTAIEALAEAVADGVMLKGFSLGHDKDCLLQLRGMLLGEWDELAGFGKRESESVKSFLSRTFDSYRDPYGTRTVKHLRTISFIGSTNQNEYLLDASGNRRYWPVRVGKIDIDRVKADAAMLWAESVSLYRSGARWWIDQDKDSALHLLCKREQSGRMVRGLLDDVAHDLAIQEALGSLPDEDGNRYGPGWHYSSRYLYSKFMPSDQIRKSDEMSIAAALKGAGWVKKASNSKTSWSLPTDVITDLRRRAEVPLFFEVPKQKTGERK